MVGWWLGVWALTQAMGAPEVSEAAESAEPAPRAGPEIALRLHTAVGVSLSHGEAWSGEAGEQPRTPIGVPLELGLEVGGGPFWVRAAGGAAPLVNGRWAFSASGEARATPVSAGAHLAGGGQFGIGRWGALVGAQWPGRVVTQAVGGVRVARVPVGFEARAGAAYTTGGRVEPAVSVVAIWQPALWRR